MYLFSPRDLLGQCSNFQNHVYLNTNVERSSTTCKW